jgi:hypothetical protein
MFKQILDHQARDAGLPRRRSARVATTHQPNADQRVLMPVNVPSASRIMRRTSITQAGSSGP